MLTEAMTSSTKQNEPIRFERSELTVTEVTTRPDEKKFLDVHERCNRSDAAWVRPLDRDIVQVFDRSRNRYFRSGEAVRWLAVAKDGTPLGRIAAFVNGRYKNKGDQFPVGGIGFFDSVDDQGVANLLFDTARTWLAERGMKAMDGPINFGERDKWWGLLVEGFYPPLYGMNYNQPYYQRLFESYGFRNFYNQICWRLPVAGVQNQLTPRFYEAHAHFSADPDFRATFIPASRLDRCIADFCTVYNKAWAKHEGNKEIGYDQAERLFKALKPVLDPYLVWFVYHKNDPVAMWISIPDINQIFRHFNGTFNWWSKLQFLYHRSRGTCDRFVGIIYGIVPEFQGTGVDYFMIVEAEKIIKSKTRYKQTELLWQGDFNPRMLNISRNLGAEQCRRLVTYRYLFDRHQPFHRHPVLS